MTPCVTNVNADNSFVGSVSNIVNKTMVHFNDKQEKPSQFRPQQMNEINDDELFNDEDDNSMPNMGGRQQVECATQ